MSEEINAKLADLKHVCLKLKDNVVLYRDTLKIKEEEFGKQRELYRLCKIDYDFKRSEKDENLFTAMDTFIDRLDDMADSTDLLREYYAFDPAQDRFAVANFKFVVVMFRATYLNFRLLKHSLPGALHGELDLAQQVLKEMFSTIDQTRISLSPDLHRKTETILKNGYTQV